MRHLPPRVKRCARFPRGARARRAPRRTRSGRAGLALAVILLLCATSNAPAVAQRGTGDEPEGLLPSVTELLFGPQQAPPPAPSSPGTTPSPAPETNPPRPSAEAPPPPGGPVPEGGPPPGSPSPQNAPPPPPGDRQLDPALSLLAPLLPGLPLPVVPPGAPPESAEPGPGRIWTLTASELALTGIRYHGHAQREVAGRMVTTLHFTIDRAEIRDLVARGVLGNGKNVKLAARQGSTSTVEGPFEFYTQELVGTLVVAGVPLVRVRLAPDTLPDIDLSAIKIPGLTFADAVLRNTDLIGGTLTVPEVFISQEQPA